MQTCDLIDGVKAGQGHDDVPRRMPAPWSA
jgi:hypothetical protein